VSFKPQLGWFVHGPAAASRTVMALRQGRTELPSLGAVPYFHPPLQVPLSVTIFTSTGSQLSPIPKASPWLRVLLFTLMNRAAMSVKKG
jgi:hypothetical protein